LYVRGGVGSCYPSALIAYTQWKEKHEKLTEVYNRVLEEDIEHQRSPKGK